MARVGIGRFQEDDVGGRQVVAFRVGGKDRLVAEPLHDVGEQGAYLGLGLADEDSHELNIGFHGADHGGIWYGSGMKRGHVLVVDDDPDIRALLKELLERQGYGVTEASTGKEALRALYSTTPDVVLLDVSMPELDGWQTLERIRDLSDVPVAMLTARAAELEKVRGLKAGADDYITKPFGRQELLGRSRRCCVVRGRARRTSTYADSLVHVDFVQRSVTVNGSAVALTPLEFCLLAAFVRHPGQLLSRPGAGAGLGRLVLGLARSGEALRRLPTPQARGRGRRRFGDRDRPRVRLPIPAVGAGQAASVRSASWASA